MAIIVAPLHLKFFQRIAEEAVYIDLLPTSVPERKPTESRNLVLTIETAFQIKVTFIKSDICIML